MEYVEIYDNHHKKMGRDGSGITKPEDKWNIIKDYATGSCLDYGCGRGKMAKYFDDYVGVDISPTAVCYALADNPGKEFHVVKNGQLGLWREFDIAICLSVFTHCLDEDVPKIFADLKRHTDKAIIDIIHGDGGDWSLMRRNPSFFNGLKHKKIGELVTPHGVCHTYYLVEGLL